MIRTALPLITLALLAGCGPTQRDAIAVEVTGDPAAGTATLVCRASTSGACHAVFVTGGVTQAVSATPGNSVRVAKLSTATSYCVGSAAPDAATCKPVPLLSGRQIVSHERSITG